MTPAKAFLRNLSGWTKLAVLIGGCFVAFLLVLGLLPRLNSTGDYTPTISLCAANLRGIGSLLTAFANAHGGHFPDRLQQIFGNQDITPEYFICPGSHDKPATGATTQAIREDLLKPGHNSYIYCGAGLLNSAPPEAILIYESPANHPNGVNFLHTDGSVDSVQPEAAPYMIDELRKGHNPPDEGAMREASDADYRARKASTHP